MLYKLTIKPCSSFSYPIQSDTLFGAFCWSYKYLYGDEELEIFLKDCIKKKPRIIFSNMFFHNMLPIPLVALEKIKKTEVYNDLKQYKQIQKINSSSFLPKEIFLQVIENNYKNVLDNAKNQKLVSVTEIHNMVNRNTGTVYEDDGSLYSVNTNFFKGKFDIYILCDRDIKDYMPVLELMFTLGIGGKKSTGKGCFEIVGKPVLEEDMIKNFDSANGFIALSNFIPNKTDSTRGYYSMINKFPKLDREFATSSTPFKKPLSMIQAGSCFYYNKRIEYCGSFLDNISNLSEKIMINACSIAIPIVLD